MAAGGLPALVDLLRRWDEPKTAEYGAAALAQLVTLCNGRRDAVCEAGALGPLQALLRHPAAATKAAASRALWNLALGSDGPGVASQLGALPGGAAASAGGAPARAFSAPTSPGGRSQPAAPSRQASGSRHSRDAAMRALRTVLRDM